MNLQNFKTFTYSSNPEVLTGEIENLTNYTQRKRNLELRKKMFQDKEDDQSLKELERLDQLYTLGDVNFDSVIIIDFGNNLKSVLTSLVYTDVDQEDVLFTTINQWFDESIFYENTIKKNFTIIDARSESRFNGTGNEPRKHLKSGRIENSINIPFQEVLRDGKYKSKRELTHLFDKKCNKEKDFVFSCGSGLTARIVMLASHIVYGKSLKLYDGSWTEWAERNNLKNIL